ncbi:MAG: methyltransferase domain-containing protein [Candidatus Sumerlaeia bacterium]
MEKYPTEKVPCPLCESCDCRPWRKSPDRLLHRPEPAWTIVACRSCGTRYLNPRPTLDSLHLHYPDRYIPYQINEKAERRFRFADPDLLSPLDRAFMEDMLGYGAYAKKGDPHPAKPFTPDFDMSLSPPPPFREEGGRLLEIGCSHGLYLERVRELGWQVEGLEMDEAAAEYAREKRGLDVRQGLFQPGMFPADTYDAIAMWQVLEHVPDPLETLRELRRLIRADGCLLIGVPNTDGLISALTGGAYAYLDAPRHFTQFTRTSLTRFLETAEFEVEWMIHPATMREMLRSMAYLAEGMGAKKIGDKIWASRRKKWMRRLERGGGRLLAKWKQGSRITALARPKV